MRFRLTEQIRVEAGKLAPATENPVLRPRLPTSRRTTTQPSPLANVRKRRAYERLCRSEWGLPGADETATQAFGGRMQGHIFTHSWLTTGNVLTLFYSLTYRPGPVNFALSPPHQRTSLGAENTARRCYRDGSEHGPENPQ